MSWGKPHFRVGEQIFAGYREENDKRTVGFKLKMAHANLAVQVPGFSRAPYVGQKGWVCLETGTVSDWEEVREMILESYRLIAPKRSLAKLVADSPSSGKDIQKARRSGAASRKLSKARLPGNRG
jgi:predicted DNA-binding protein (MmcQ/YjbR family)